MERRPCGQEEQAIAPPEAKEPAAHGDATSKPATAHAYPAGQGGGTAVPAEAHRVPGGQSAHAPSVAAPVAALYVPAGQGVAAAEPAGQKPPAGHTASGAERRVAEQSEPAVHGTQAAALAFGPNVPAPHGTGAPLSGGQAVPAGPRSRRRRSR
jgi:hypothetical protein